MPKQDKRADFATVALWAVNLAKPLNGMGAWIAGLDGKLAEAASAGADILVLPEYVSEQWLSYAPEGIAPKDEIAWMADEGARALDQLKGLAAKHDMAVLAGSFPARAKGFRQDGPAFVNRAFLFLPDGRMTFQDKLCLTPIEKNAEAWNLNVGAEVTFTQWRGLRIATLICLDVELPALASAIAKREPDLDLLLVPSMTEKESGYSRVFGCAKARAVELQTTVCAVGSIGSVTPDGSRPNFSGAAVVLPCEEPLGFNGRFAEVEGRASAEDDGPLLIARDVPVGLVRELRKGGDSEVWPGSWSAEHVSFGEN